MVKTTLEIIAPRSGAANKIVVHNISAMIHLLRYKNEKINTRFILYIFYFIEQTALENFLLCAESSENLDGGHFGLTVSADEYDMFTCAPYAGHQNYSLNNFFITGVCYK